MLKNGIVDIWEVYKAFLWSERGGAYPGGHKVCVNEYVLS